MKKLLIADASEEFSAALQECLQDSYLIKVCRDGNETLQTMESFCPDVMVLDLLLPGVDGVTLLHTAQKRSSLPMVLAVTRFYSDYMMDAMERLGVGYAMMKPCEAEAVAARVADLMQETQMRAQSQPSLETQVDKILRELRFQTHPRGYACLRVALMEEVRNPGQQVTKTLYPAVGKICGGNGEQAERAIRLSIQKAWFYRHEEVWSRFFPAEPDGKLECPSNKAFISTIARHILEESQKKDTYLRKSG